MFLFSTIDMATISSPANQHIKDLKLSIKFQERYFPTFEGKLRKNCFTNTNINGVCVEPSFNIQVT